MAEKNIQTVILNHQQIGQKINRIAHEILENNFQEKSIVILGIKEEGFILAQRLVSILETISDMQIELHDIKLNKRNPLASGLSSSVEPTALKNKIVILVDDVLNSGKTLVYSTKFLLDHNIKGLQTVCLVDRKHRKFPIRADYVGLTLSTTLKEHITVKFGKSDSVFLD
ncbi:MAG: phosphoribosyltransferase family protein [Salibacteraceae bacterium]